MDINIARERISYIVKPDSITTSQGDFLATHVAINKLHLLEKFDIQPNGRKNYSEEDVFEQYVANPSNKHQFIAVYGQSGTGKSHLIRWFAARFAQTKPENEVILFIRRSDNTLKGTIRQLLEKPEVQGIKNREVFERLVKASVSVEENKLKDMIYHNFIIEINNDDDSHQFTIPNVKKKRLVAFLNNDVIHDYLMMENGPIERMYSKIAEHTLVDRDTIAQFLPKDFYVTTDLYDNICRTGADAKAEKMARELMADASGIEAAENYANYMNQFVNDVIQRCAGIEPGDFRQIFQDIRKELYRLGKNLTLFIEDVTSFTGVDEALLDALIIEHTGMNAADQICRISSIVGTTSNYLQNNFRDNHKDRITQYVYIPSGVFNTNEIYEFVARYVNVMSLTEESISSWVHGQANPVDYPVHEVKQGTNWEYVKIKHGKRLCLYPFTKNSINYFYNYVLTNGQQTPRYIIRDIIEPVIYDLINNPKAFPSIKINLVNVNTKLSYGIHNQIKDEHLAERLLRFLCIWGTGLPEQSQVDNITYISGISETILTELGFPILRFSEIKKPERDPEPKPDPEPGHDPEPKPGSKPKHKPVPIEIQKRVDKANAILTSWREGKPIDVSATVGFIDIIKKAQSDMCAYLYTAINWQVEGISDDNITKIKESSKKLITFENQTKGISGFYQLPATWDSISIVQAFIRWREYGKNSWNYDNSDLDAFIVSSWLAKIKQDIVKAVSDQVEPPHMSYIEASITAEIYRLILCGEFKEHSLKNFTLRHLFESIPVQTTNTGHCKEWIKLISVLFQKNAASINQKTLRQYYNLTQGTGTANVVVLDEPELVRVVRKIKVNKLRVSEENLQLNDPVKLRKDVFVYLKDILDRIGAVTKAETDKAREILQFIYDNLKTEDVDEIEEDDILDLVDKADSFYGEINATQINITVGSTVIVKKSAKQIAKAISDIDRALVEEDMLNTLMIFSSDPISILQPLVELLNRLMTDIEKLNQKLLLRMNALGTIINPSEPGTQYVEEKQTIEKDSNSVARLR